MSNIYNCVNFESSLSMVPNYWQVLASRRLAIANDNQTINLRCSQRKDPTNTLINEYLNIFIFYALDISLFSSIVHIYNV